MISREYDMDDVKRLLRNYRDLILTMIDMEAGIPKDQEKELLKEVQELKGVLTALGDSKHEGI